ncbi:MAG TPA: twin-arginine translocase subunit TatC [Clostridia bacterium]|nr:twin-arginine translocase subunit TatC [Clostridia bacterium]
MENGLEDGPRLTLMEHLGELRKRVVISFIAIIVCAFAAYRYIDKIIDIITRPAGELEFIYLSPPELFMSYIKICLVLGLVISSPIILFQIWGFIKPGLKIKEKKYVVLALSMGTVFLLMGVVFAYYVIVPMTIKFFIGVSVGKIAPLFSFANYVSFVSSLLLSFGLVFELPLLIILLTQLGLVVPKTLKKYRKFVILIIFIVSAILTPPDVVSQVLMAIPMTLLYELGIIVSTIIYRKKKKEQTAQDES